MVSKDSVFMEITFKGQHRAYVIKNKQELKQALKKAEQFYTSLLDK
jgi:hypothetical protein